MSRLAKAIGRAVFALLLMLAAATPAFAEIGCLEDQFEHSAGQAPDIAPDILAAVSDASGDEDRGRPSGQPVHCAFSHCTHAFPSSPPHGDGAGHLAPSLTYMPLVALPLAGALSNGPDDPPRA